MPGQYDKTTYGGKTVDWYTRAALEAAAAELGYSDGLTIVQGSYNKGVGASAGTHDGGGAVDLAPFEADRKVRVLRKYGFAAWHRLPSQGPWGEHVHAVQVGNAKLSPAAASQVADYKAGRNGLASHAKDDGPREFVGTVFPWPPPVTVRRLRARVVDAAHHFTGTILWQLARDNGIRVFMHKVTEGATVVDPAYRKRRADGDAFNAKLSLLGRLLGRGIRQGGYHYASPDGPKVDDAMREADWFLEHLIVGKYDAAPWLDFEELNGLTMSQADRWCEQWMARVRSKGIKSIGLYLPNSWDLPNAQESADFVIRARYNDDNRAPDLPYDIHQFSDGDLGTPNRIPGFGGGKVDLNAFRKGFRVRDMRLKLASKPAPEPTPEPTPEPVLVDIPVVSYNYGNKPEQTRADLDMLAASGAVLIAGQETRDRQVRINEWLLTHPEWARVPFVDGNGTTDLTTIYRPDRLRLIDQHSVLVAGKTNVGDGKAHSGAGPDNLNPKSIVVTQFQERASGRLLTHINAHQIASWTRTKAYLGAEEWQARRDYGKHMIELIVAEVEKVTHGLVVVTGDLNATKGFVHMKPLAAAVDLGDSPPTSGGRAIDYIGVRDHESLVSVERSVLAGYSSDHKPLLGVLRVESRP